MILLHQLNMFSITSVRQNIFIEKSCTCINILLGVNVHASSCVTIHTCPVCYLYDMFLCCTCLFFACTVYLYVKIIYMQNRSRAEVQVL